MKLFLGIETSCDDTSAALVREDGFVVSMGLASQDDVHRPFGGIVPEIASRNHTHHLLNIIERVLQNSNSTWDNVDGIAVTNRPGLLGSLLVGVVTAKTLAYSKNKPFVGVHHLEGHIMAPFLRDLEYHPPQFWTDPFLALVVSGGHTAIYKVDGFGKYKLLAQTIDDAAGEAFDKFAKMLGLGYPGGAQIDKLSVGHNEKKYNFPIGLKSEVNFSFSGLKTSALTLLEKMKPEQIQNEKNDLCASYQAAIVDALVLKTNQVAENEGINKVVVSGGVSANSRLRKKMQDWADKNSIELLIPPMKYCTDNAAMIALAGAKKILNNETADLDLGVFARSDLDHA